MLRYRITTVVYCFITNYLRATKKLLMRAIGFRASPDEIIYTILEIESRNAKILAQDKLIIPVSLDFPEQLNYIRRTFRDILFEYDVKVAGIRKTESMASTFGKKLSIERISYEAILQELICSSTVERYFVGQISTIAAKLGLKSEKCSSILKGQEYHFGTLDLNGQNEKKRESILVALASAQ